MPPAKYNGNIGSSTSGYRRAKNLLSIGGKLVQARAWGAIPSFHRHAQQIERCALVQQLQSRLLHGIRPSKDLGARRRNESYNHH